MFSNIAGLPDDMPKFQEKKTEEGNLSDFDCKKTSKIFSNQNIFGVFLK